MAAHQIISISKFKATCLAVLAKVKRTGQPVLVTKYGKPIAWIEPPPPPEKKKSWLGSFKKQGKIIGNVISPAFDEDEWEVLNE
jgi:prevent-host-death family protein